MASLTFRKGLYENLSGAEIVDGQVLVCEDQGLMFVDVTGGERLQISDFQILPDVAALQELDPTEVPTIKFYYVEVGNMLVKSNGTTWVQVNAQKTTEELIEDLKLADYATVVYVDEELDKKADASVIDAMYTNDEIDAAIKVATDAVAALDTKVGDIPTTSDAKTIIEYIDDKTSGIATDAALAELQKDVDALEEASATHATKSEVEAVDGKFADYTKTADQQGIDAEQDAKIKAIADDYVKAADIADFETKANVKKVADDLAALDGTVKGMYTDAAIDELIQGAKDYADENDADTKYGITYDSSAKKIKLVEGGIATEIDATAFIKDGMIDTVTLDGNNDLVITFNTEAGKDAIVLPLDKLIDVYTGKATADIIVATEGNEISATLTDTVKASLAKADAADANAQGYADTAEQNAKDYSDSLAENYAEAEHEHVADDITDFADAVKVVKVDEAVNADEATKATQDGNGRVIADTYAEKATTLEGYGITDAYTKEEVSNQDAVVLSEAQKYADQVEIDAVAAAKTETEGQIEAFAETVYTKEEVEALFTWGTF